MKRYTKPDNNGYRLLPEAFTSELTGPAADRLGALEDLYEALLNEQDRLSRELAGLRERGQTRSYHFRERMARKLNISTVLRALEEIFTRPD